MLKTFNKMLKIFNPEMAFKRTRMKFRIQILNSFRGTSSTNNITKEICKNKDFRGIFSNLGLCSNLQGWHNRLLC